MFEEFIDINERQVYQFLNYCYERDEKLYVVKDIALDLNYTLAKMNSVIQQAESFCERYPEYKLSFSFRKQDDKSRVFFSVFTE